MPAPSFLPPRTHQPAAWVRGGVAEIHICLSWRPRRNHPSSHSNVCTHFSRAVKQEAHKNVLNAFRGYEAMRCDPRVRRCLLRRRLTPTPPRERSPLYSSVCFIDCVRRRDMLLRRRGGGCARGEGGALPVLPTFPRPVNTPLGQFQINHLHRNVARARRLPVCPLAVRTAASDSRRPLVVPRPSSAFMVRCVG